MILTITPNPSVDISYKIDTLKIDDVNRCNQVRKTAGGKGLNVTRVLNQLGPKIEATGFLGGILGKFIEEELEKLEVATSFIKTDSNTRNCIAILHDNGNQTEILEQSEEIDSKFEEEFMKKIESIMMDKDVITCSGSLPKGISEDFYLEVIKASNKLGKKIIADTSGKQLEKIVMGKDKPFAIKPNVDEIRDLLKKCGHDEWNRSDLVIDDGNIGKILNSHAFKGIELVLVSAGKSGGYFRYNGEVFKISIPVIKAANPVGSGDSTVAGLAYGIDSGKDIETSVKIAMTCGVLNAAEEITGYINIDNFDEIYSKIEIERI